VRTRRLFVALNLPRTARERIHWACRSLRDRNLPVPWVDPENYHITLKCLGEVRTDRLQCIEEIVAHAAAKSAPFAAALYGFGAFPTDRRPGVLGVGVELTPALRCLKQDVEWVLTRAGFERETRVFHHHLTLGRVGRENGAGAFHGLDEVLAVLPYAGSMAVTSVELMRSHTSRGGVRYTVISSYPLTDG
jgi:2'-5' RNA ligase